MEYKEQDEIVDLQNLGVPFFRTGSREICNPPVMNTGVDFFVCDFKGINFERIGFQRTNPETDNYGSTDFETYRRGEVNIIVVGGIDDFQKWRVATAAQSK